jgi:tetratricopeptide (TPR) repeat protein
VRGRLTLAAIVLAGLGAGCERHGDGNRAGAAADPARDAEAWSALGNQRLAAGDASSAIIAFERAIAHRAPADRLGRRRDARGLYRSYFEVEKYQLAMHYAAVAYQLVDEPGDPETRASVLAGVAALAYDLGDLPASEAVIAVADRVISPPGPTSPGESARAWITLRQVRGLVELAHKRYQLARADLSAAARGAHAAGLTSLARYAAINLTAAELRAGDVDAAAAALAAAPPLSAGDDADQVPVAYAAAQVALALGHDEQAIDITTAAARGLPVTRTCNLDELRGRALVRVNRIADAEAAFRRSIDGQEALARDLDMDALKGWLIERQRAPFEGLFQLYVSQGRVADGFDIVQRATARAVIDGLSRAPDAKATPIPQVIERAGARVDAMRALVHALRVSPASRPPVGPALRRQLAGRDVLTYFRAGDALWLVALAPDGALRARRLGDVPDLERRVSALRRSPERLELADDLGARLLPMEMLPAAGRTIDVVLDDPIRSVSFATLRVDGRYLAARNPIAYSPSAAVLASLLAIAPRGGPAIIVGDPSADLPSARLEADDVAQVMHVSPHVGAQASTSAVRAGSGAVLLHIAAHTRDTAIGPALALADGYIGANDVLEHGIAAQVVVLLSCASADPGSRDQLGPLASAFLAAGSGTVVASRWAIEDDVARRFARHFYAAGGARDPVVATVVAQRRLAAEGVAPAAWDAFVVLGGVAAPNRPKESEP